MISPYEYQDDVTAWLISTNCFAKERQKIARSTTGERTVIPKPMLDSTRDSRKLDWWDTIPLAEEDGAETKKSLRTSETVVVADILWEEDASAAVRVCRRTRRII